MNTDSHGDVIGLTDASGAQVVSYSYDAYGSIASTAGDQGLAKANPYRYSGYYYDEETQLYYLLTRYYDPSLGRFISKDSEQGNPLLSSWDAPTNSTFAQQRK